MTEENLQDNIDFILLGDGGAEAEESDDDDANDSLESTNKRYDDKGDATAWFARMEGTRTMAKKVAGEHEKKKFWDEYKRYHCICEHGTRDWSSMAEAWNSFVAGREKTGDNEVVKYYRKHAHMLETFFESGSKSNNITATLQPHLKAIENLIKDHRVPVASPTTSVNAPRPSAIYGPNAISDINTNSDFSQIVPLIPLSMISAAVLTTQDCGPIVYPGQLQQTNVKNSKKRALDRALQQCMICGHFRQHNLKFNDKHIGKCIVPESNYSTDRSLKGWCPCLECVAGAEIVGYCKPLPIIKEMRALKTCKICGHYKHAGHYKQDHSNTDCRVAHEDKCHDRYQGYCPCDHCIETTLSSGREKVRKLRKIIVESNYEH